MGAKVRCVVSCLTEKDQLTDATGGILMIHAQDAQDAQDAGWLYYSCCCTVMYFCYNRLPTPGAVLLSQRSVLQRSFLRGMLSHI
jgi:hypothetical protein